jgi:Fe-S oxidoreductase
MLATQNVEVLDEAGATKTVVTCAHCFNTLKNEYPDWAAATRSSTTPSCWTGWCGRVG